MRPLIFLVTLLLVTQLSFALTCFGPSTALNCQAAPIVITKSDYYQWDPSVGGNMIEGTGTGPCITVDADNVVVDCVLGAGGRGNIDGQKTKVSGIYIAPGRSNITIKNCRVLDFFGSNIYIEGGKPVNDIRIENTVLTYDNSLANNADDIACVKSSNITIDGVTAITKATHPAVMQSGLGDGAGGRATCDDVTILNSHFDSNNNFGVYLEGDNFRAENSFFDSNGLGGVGLRDGVNIIGENHYIYNNSISNNEGGGLRMGGAPNSQIISNAIISNDGDGARIEFADNLYIYDNNVSDSDSAGLYLEDTRNSAVESNYFWNNGKYGLYLSTNNLKYNENVSVLSNDVYHNDYGMFIENTTDSFVDNNYIYDSMRGGMDMADVYSSDFTNNYVDNNGGWGIRCFRDFDTVTFYRNTVNRTTGDGIRINGTSNPGIVFIEDVMVDNTGYGMGIYSPADIIANKTMIYGKIDEYLYVVNTTTFDSFDFWLGYDDASGISWPHVKFTGTTIDVTDKNLLLGADFVSLDASDPLIEEFNETARITVLVPGCSMIKYYGLDGFPASKNEIMTNGYQFMPIFSQCVGALATFEVPSFSGYTANGSTYSPPGGNGGQDHKELAVSTDVICPGDIVEFTVTYQGNPVSNAEIELSQYDPYLGLIATGYTGDDGKVQFTMPRDAVYRARITREGYDYMNPYVIDYTMCEAEEIPEEEPEEQPPAEEPEVTAPPEEVEEEPEEEIIEEEITEEPEIVEEVEEEIPMEEPEPEPEEEFPCLLSSALLIILGIGVGAYYWLVMRKRK